MTNSKSQLLKNMSRTALKALEVIAQNPQGVTVKDLMPILHFVHSTVYNLLNELCALDLLVRSRNGDYGSYLYYLHPSVDPVLIQWALGTSAGNTGIVFNSPVDDVSENSIQPSSTAADLSEVNQSDQSINVGDLKKMLEEAIGEQERAFEKFKKVEKVLNQLDV